jgi:methylmalonyl-CoA mutase C-terminal domain/subunit
MTLVPRVQELLREAGAGDVVVFAGGIIPDADAETLRAGGVSAIFGPGTDTSEIVAAIRAVMAARPAAPES